MVIDNPKIEWSLLSKAIEFYESNDFKYVEVPWIVPQYITNITSQDRDKSFNTNIGDMVGSAEQAFLYLTINNKLPHGQYCALTPCYRNEEKIDNLSRYWFMKVELIKTDVVNDDELSKMINLCTQWFGNNTNAIPQIIETNEGYDININNIEVGSYGIRSFNDVKWIYATGLALPRFTEAKKAG